MSTSSKMKERINKRAKKCGYSDEMENIGARMKEKRGSCSLTKFSNKLNDVKYELDPATISKYESGYTRIPSDLLYVLAKQFQWDINYILTGDDHSTPDPMLRKELEKLSRKYPPIIS